MTKRRVKPEHVRREEIMNAALDVIYEVGLSNTTIAQIAKKAELSTGIVSHYFGDKQGLINTCMQEMLNVFSCLKVGEESNFRVMTAQAP